jgi:phosphoglycerate dehydrogenase-like enzyme
MVMAGTFKIAMMWHADEQDYREYCKVLSPGCSLLNPKSGDLESLKEIAVDADALIGVYIHEEVIEVAKSVKMVQILHAGVATAYPGDVVLGFDPRILKQRGVLMGNIHGNARAVAEQAMAFIMACAKQVVPCNHATSQNQWYPFTEETKSDMLNDSTLLILGLGHIGALVAKYAKAFDMTVMAIDRDPNNRWAKELDLDYLGTPDKLMDVIGKADFVHCSLPLTRETMNSIGREEIGAMKKSAYLINTSRGNIINEQALYDALVEGRIKGFASDVWWMYSYSVTANSFSKNESESWFDFGFHYGLPSRLGVNRLPMVIGSNDRASYTKGLQDSFIFAGLRNVDMLARGERPANIVDIDKGF